jgi:hypothetical protein
MLNATCSHLRPLADTLLPPVPAASSYRADCFGTDAACARSTDDSQRRRKLLESCAVLPGEYNFKHPGHMYYGIGLGWACGRRKGAAALTTMP